MGCGELPVAAATGVTIVSVGSKLSQPNTAVSGGSMGAAEPSYQPSEATEKVLKSVNWPKSSLLSLLYARKK